VKHILPALPYDVSALEPHVDVRTMTLHHNMHHAAYVTALNLALESVPESLRLALQAKTAEWLLLHLEKIPEEIKKLAEEREEARKNKDFKKSDELRQKINSLGYEIKDSPEGYKINKI